MLPPCGQTAGTATLQHVTKQPDGCKENVKTALDETKTPVNVGRFAPSTLQNVVVDIFCSAAVRFTHI